MYELGVMKIEDPEATRNVRVKVLGLMHGLGADDVAASRIATAVSEITRYYVLAGVHAVCSVRLEPLDTHSIVSITFESNGRAPDLATFRSFFDTAVVRERGEGVHEVCTEATTPLRVAAVTDRLIARERARLAQRSRQELMAELRETNLQLERYNESLEQTVAERTEALSTANQRMRRDLDAGASYVRGLIPAPIEGPLSLDWRYIPSSTLGGDTIGYHWLDDDQLAIYLIDVTGHGLDSALHAVTITNVIRAGSLSGAAMDQPGDVLGALNGAFQSGRHGNKFFTIWYGVFNVRTRVMTWSGGGHHPSVLLPPGVPDPVLLDSTGTIMGALPSESFETLTCEIPSGARLLIFSDGVFEIVREGRLVWSLNDCNQFIGGLGVRQPGSLMDALLAEVRRLGGSDDFEDDVSIIEATFG